MGHNHSSTTTSSICHIKKSSCLKSKAQSTENLDQNNNSNQSLMKSNQNKSPIKGNITIINMVYDKDGNINFNKSKKLPLRDDYLNIGIIGTSISANASAGITNPINNNRNRNNINTIKQQQHQHRSKYRSKSQRLYSSLARLNDALETLEDLNRTNKRLLKYKLSPVIIGPRQTKFSYLSNDTNKYIIDKKNESKKLLLKQNRNCSSSETSLDKYIHDDKEAFVSSKVSSMLINDQSDLVLHRSPTIDNIILNKNKQKHQQKQQKSGNEMLNSKKCYQQVLIHSSPSDNTIYNKKVFISNIDEKSSPKKPLMHYHQHQHHHHHHHHHHHSDSYESINSDNNEQDTDLNDQQKIEKSNNNIKDDSIEVSMVINDDNLNHRNGNIYYLIITKNFLKIIILKLSYFRKN
jgi:hypothetical protein